VIIFVLLFSFLLSALAVFHRVDRYQPELSRPFQQKAQRFNSIDAGPSAKFQNKHDYFRGMMRRMT
jgi:hypothetical protein